MGEYYIWVNADRKEYISPTDFDCGNKKYESCNRYNEMLRALIDLMFNEWKGCRILWMGDESYLPKHTDIELFDIMKSHYIEAECKSYMFDAIYDTYRNISGLFKSAETEVRSEVQFFLELRKKGDIDSINSYGVDIFNPYEGLFKRKGMDCDFVVNKTKSIGYSRDYIAVLHKNGRNAGCIDPLPFLLGYNDRELGEWVGDVIDVCNELPRGVTLIDSIRLDR